jgi:uncharacterized protein YegJ (DUF2314 family)
MGHFLRKLWNATFGRLWSKFTGKKPEHRLISFVALLKEPVHLDARIVATAASKAWDADLSGGEDEEPSEDGFVVGVDITMMVQFRDRMLIVNSFPKPYTEDPEQHAEHIGDLRLRALFAQHTAWMSCDALGVDATTPDEDIREFYRLCGRLMARLVDDNTLAVVIPEGEHNIRMYPNSEELEDLLNSADPYAAVTGQAYVPVVPVSGDDPRMLKAVAEAKSRWPEFVAAFESKKGHNFAVKNPVTRGENTEFIWIEVTAIENDVIYGKLANDPVDLGDLKCGSRVKVAASELNDWGYMDDGDNFVGGFTVKVIQQVAEEHAKQVEAERRAEQKSKPRRK